MKSQLYPTLVGLLLLGPSTAESAVESDNVCTQFVEQHADEPSWEQACLEWLISYESSAPGAAEAGTLGEAANASSVSVQHASAANLTLAADNQNEAFIAVDPSEAGAGRAFVISKTHPFDNGLFAAHSTDYGTSWSPTVLGVARMARFLQVAQIRGQCSATQGSCSSPTSAGARQPTAFPPEDDLPSSR